MSTDFNSTNITATGNDLTAPWIEMVVNWKRQGANIIIFSPTKLGFFVRAFSTNSGRYHTL
jgi:hypothetical protein